MRDPAVLVLHLMVTVARLAGRGGARSLVAESVLLQHQLLILSRSRQRSPNLRFSDRVVLGVSALLMRSSGLIRSAIVVKPSTLLRLHRALTKRIYRRLFSPTVRRKPGPRGPAPDLIAAVVDMKRRNPTWGCPRIAQQIGLAFGIAISKDVVRRILAMRSEPGPDSAGPSWLTLLGHDGVGLCRMFNRATRGHTPPTYVSSDHDPLYRFHQWQRNLRILDVKEIKTVPYVPLSHPFVERLIGTIRRECLDYTLFWTGADLQMKLLDFQRYFNGHRTHAGLDGARRTRALARAAHMRISVRIDGRCTVIGGIRHRWRRDVRTTAVGIFRSSCRVDRLTADPVRSA